MNCQDFERIINDLARDSVMEATQRASGLAHTETCARCAARLADERALTLGLRSLATSVQQAKAPARVEAALVSAFRERDGGLQPGHAVQTASAAERQRRRWAASIAAAVALLFIALAASRLYQERSPQQQAVAKARDSQPLKLAAWPSSRDKRAPSPEPAGLATERGPQPQLAFQRISNGTRRSMNGNNPGGDSIKSPQPAGGATASSTGSNIATDFIPLTYGANLSGLDSGRVVRVELPRTALARFGLPMNAERAAEPVKADVLLGEDGLAQAIRFVR